MEKNFGTKKTFLFSKIFKKEKIISLLPNHNRTTKNSKRKRMFKKICLPLNKFACAHAGIF
jgi:hypothetical protein